MTFVGNVSSQEESCQFLGENVGEGEMAGILGKLRMLCRCLLDELWALTIPIVTVASNPQNRKLRLLSDYEILIFWWPSSFNGGMSHLQIYCHQWH